MPSGPYSPHPEAFKDTTRAPVLKYNNSFFDLAVEDVQSVLGLEIFRKSFSSRPTGWISISKQWIEQNAA
jgi:hypothetical protein